MFNIIFIKIIAISFFFFVFSGATIATGIIFGNYVQGLALNPDESDKLLTASLLGFALVESFVFLSSLLAVFIWFC